MKLVDATELLLRIAAHDRRDSELVVEVLSRGSAGPHPCVSVASIHAGFDWDAGKVIIKTERSVTELLPNDVEAIKADVKAGSSWHAYQREKARQEEISAIRDQRDQLLAALKGVKDLMGYEWLREEFYSAQQAIELAEKTK